MIGSRHRRRRQVRFAAGVGALLIVTMVPVVVTPARATAGPALARPGFSWSVAPRFGLDADADGIIEIENDRGYTHNRAHGSCAEQCPPILLETMLTARPTPQDLGLPASGFLTYEWRLTVAGSLQVHHRTKPDLVLLLPEGSHDVDLRVTVRLPWGTVTTRARGDLTVEDILVVAVGDSYASGEGNPDVRRGADPAQWADAFDSSVRSDHASAHRSTVAWPARVALALEDADPASSVTFVDLAASGATIDRGLLGARGDPAVPAQLDEVARIVEQRRIDVLLIQIGGNDVGFARVIRALVEADPLLDPICYRTRLDNIWASAEDGVWDRGTRIGYEFPARLRCRETEGSGRKVIPGLDGLGDALDRLADRLGDLDVGRVLVVEYPDPTGGTDRSDSCDEIVGDVTAPFGFHEVDRSEQAAGYRKVLEPLNRELEAAARRHGWTFVAGIAEAFASGHGYCAPWPNYGYPDEFESSPLIFRRRLSYPDGWYRPPGRHGGPLQLDRGPVSWYRTAGQSAALQGPTPRFRTAGTLHPNEIGHQVVARSVLSALAGSD